MSSNPPVGPKREERRAITDRMLVIEAELAESKRAYLVDGQGMSRSARATAEAELARLRLQRTRLDIEVKNEERALLDKIHDERRNGLLAILTDMLADRGLASIVAEAKQRQAEYIAASEAAAA